MASGAWYMTPDIANEFFFIPIRRQDLMKFAFIGDLPQLYSISLALAYVNSLALCITQF